MQISMRMRAVATLLLAWLLSISDGSAIWSQLIPTLLVSAALAILVVDHVRRRESQHS
jgi:hypothetical protein